ncbi:MAG: hypothetical protein H6Q89_798 [Myxococcaceae bacterium]|nr:hypothetical protein [Myxococcaceae bacterium]
MGSPRCTCGHCEECQRGASAHFSRRGVLGALVGAAAVGGARAAAQTRGPTPDPAAVLKQLEAEAFLNLKGLYVAQKAYFAEKDRFTTNLDEVGFAPDEWCEDGARLRIKEKPTAFRKIGCHFIYEVETLGAAPQMEFRAYARGAVGAALGFNYLVESSGDQRGIPRRNPR